MRRRALCAASAASGGGGEQSWAYELHLTPEWEEEFWATFYYIEGDFSQLFEKLYNMLIALGNSIDETIYLSDIPNEYNFTIDGERLSEVRTYYHDEDTLEVIFGDYYCYGTIGPGFISVEKEL